MRIEQFGSLPIASDDAIEYEFSAGHLKDRKLKLSPMEAKKFTITMTSYHLAYKNKKQ